MFKNARSAAAGLALTALAPAAEAGFIHTLSYGGAFNSASDATVAHHVGQRFNGAVEFVRTTDLAPASNFSIHQMVVNNGTFTTGVDNLVMTSFDTIASDATMAPLFDFANYQAAATGTIDGRALTGPLNILNFGIDHTAFTSDLIQDVLNTSLSSLALSQLSLNLAPTGIFNQVSSVSGRIDQWNHSFRFVDDTVSVVEPGTLALMGLGLVAVGLISYQRRNGGKANDNAEGNKPVAAAKPEALNQGPK